MEAIIPEGGITTRLLTEEDIESVRDIDRKIRGRERVLTYENQFDSFLGGELDISCVAELQGKVVGFIFGRFWEFHYGTANGAWIDIIGVDPQYQRLGIGRKLVVAFIEQCHHKGAEEIHMVINRHDRRMVTFLRSLGFLESEVIHYVKPLEERLR